MILAMMELSSGCILSLITVPLVLPHEPEQLFIPQPRSQEHCGTAIKTAEVSKGFVTFFFNSNGMVLMEICSVTRDELKIMWFVWNWTCTLSPALALKQESVALCLLHFTPC